MGTRSAATALAIVTVLALPAAVSGASDNPRRLQATNRGLTENATLGSSCITEPDGEFATLCSDAAYPLKVNGRLPVKPRSRLLLRTGIAAKQLTVHTLRSRKGGSTLLAKLAVKRLGKSGRRWQVRLPRKLAGANVVDVFVQWTGPAKHRNDADFWAGIRPER